MSRDRRSVLVAGAGGHAKSVIEVLLEYDDFEVVGCTSVDGKGGPVLGIPVVGPDHRFSELFALGVGLGVAAIAIRANGR